MPKLEDSKQLLTRRAAETLPVTVIVAARNEAHNLPRCLESLQGFGEIYVIDSQSSDATVQVAESCGRTWCNFRIREAGPRSGSGPWIRCLSATTGFFWWTQMRRLLGSWPPKFEAQFRIQPTTATTSRCACFSCAGNFVTAARVFTNFRCSGEGRVTLSAGSGPGSVDGRHGNP